METEIAKENVKKYDDLKSKYDETQEKLGLGKEIGKYTLGDLNDDMVVIEHEMLIHKQTCQRWLEFEEKWYDSEGAEGCECELCKELGKKIKDLKQAIKIYDEAGI